MRHLGLTTFLLGLLPATIASPIENHCDTPAECAVILCPTNHQCIVRNGKGTCVPIGGSVCGPTICAQGLVCCNASCGTCTKPGMACTQQACLGPQCGKIYCPFGETCCNPSCGYCVKPGGGCTKELCL
ncbi:hypothetical protein B0T16DRAFT_395625 [Cercophora newfieldiana]|uniref:Uncharacterized protein n=1 Tax=Cercophora newfieldiana TaxID=92897 RepID=A0AA39YLF0_9PEZI|nr:hypothetical protein B0T16DRAFT_395625 [Cercophora newfieldiana]